MVQAQDLRLGNIVQLCFAHKEGWYNARVTAIHPGNRIDTDTADSIGQEYYYEPIPLSPKILEAAGFEKMLLGEKICFGKSYKRRDSPDDPHLYQIILIDFGHYDLKNKNKYCLAIREFDRDIQMGITSVDFLHQLQNNFYSLTGEELTIDINALTEKV